MDDFLNDLIPILTEWGYIGMFLSALLAGSIVPFSSELVMAGLVKLGSSPFLILMAATLGNTAGGMTCYYMGYLGRMDRIERWLGVKPEKVERVRRWLQGKGALMAFFAFLPIVGEALAMGCLQAVGMLPGVSRSGSPIARNRIALELQQGAGGLQSRADMTSSRSLNHVRALPGAAIPGWADAS